MGPTICGVATDPDAPKQTGVVIIGGGIIGASTALFLSMRGIAVTLFEKGRIAGEQSSRNWGWVRKMGRDPRELPLMIESEVIWHALAGLTGIDIGYKPAGIAYLCTNPQETAKREAWLEMARPFGLDTHMLGREGMARLFPDIAAANMTALYTPSDGRAEPQVAVPAIIAAARQHGAKVVTGCAVRAIETSAGRLSSVITERGETRCDAAVLAGGAWSSLFCGNVAIRLPQLKVRASVARTAPIENGPDCAALGPDYAFRRRADGGYTITRGLSVTADIVPDSFRFLGDFLPLLQLERRSVNITLSRRTIDEFTTRRRWAADEVTPFEKTRVLDPQPPEAIDQMLDRSMTDAFPVFRNARVVQHWAGLIDATPDTVPVISPVAACPNFFIGTGFSGHGFGIGPGAGRLLADLVSGDRPVVDPTPFRFERFSDGSKSRPLFGI
jgi:glycine/D-amino acid oxidase-like deaminating enzyme